MNYILIYFFKNNKGPYPLTNKTPSTQHRQSMANIEMKRNPMKNKEGSIVHDLHGEMQPTSWV
jgi:hypothetical protein